MKPLSHYTDLLGLTWFTPLVRLAKGEDRQYQLRQFLWIAGVPLLAITLALVAWHLAASQLKLGSLTLPTPGLVAEKAWEQVTDWRDDRAARAKHEAAILATASEQNMPVEEVRQFMPFQGKKLFIDQILLSLQTVFVGVGLAMLVAIPIGILCGLSATMSRMLDPFIQLFKPVSPLAWFPVVYLFINKLIVGNDGPISKSFLIAAIVVGLCSLWPALVNTVMGVANVEQDHLNIARVLNLPWYRRVWSIILPSSMPAIFTGIRVSLGVGWMVLIAAEMMAVSPGIGGFVWDWYQSSNDVAMAYLVLAVLVIGAIGLALDRICVTAQRLVTRGAR